MGNCMSTGEPWLDITLLCKVVDNYGDIGFVYRLARSLSRIEPSVRLRFIVSDLVSFAKMAPGLRVDTAEQTYNGWTVLDWNSNEVCTASYKKNPPKVILECFQCGRPSWLDDILFDKNRTDIVHILNVEYLTAEKWADDFHLLKSGTRSSLVKKVNFMPGFSPKTGGLVLDEPFISYRHNRTLAVEALSQLNVPSLAEQAHCCNIVVFSYERDFTPEVQAFAEYERLMKQHDASFKLHIFLANGKSRKPFLDACEKIKPRPSAVTDLPVAVTELPFLPQSTWDALLTLTDFSLVRGEDSLSRAVLAGVPFVWHAYPQTEEYQLVKVEALLDAMEPFFEPEDFLLVKQYWLLYNMTRGAVSGKEAAAVVQKAALFEKKSVSASCSPDVTKSAVAQGSVQNGVTMPNSQKDCALAILMRLPSIKRGFSAFASFLESNGDLAEKLIEYLKQLHF